MSRTKENATSPAELALLKIESELIYIAPEDLQTAERNILRHIRDYWRDNL